MLVNTTATVQSTVKIMIHDEATTTGDENDRYDTFLSCFFPYQVTFRGIPQFGTSISTLLKSSRILSKGLSQIGLYILSYNHHYMYQTGELLDRRSCNIG